MKSNSAFQRHLKVEALPHGQNALFVSARMFRLLHERSTRCSDNTSYSTFSIYLFSTLSRVPAEVDTAKTCGLHSNACKGQLSGQLAHYSMSAPDRLETHKTNAVAHPKGHLWILMCNFN